MSELSDSPETPAPAGQQQVHRPGLAELGERLPGLARIAADSWLHTAQWSVTASAKGARRLAEAATDTGKAAELAAEVGQVAAAVGEVATALAAGVPLPRALAATAARLGAIVRPAEGPAPVSLRDRGEALLSRSRDVWEADRAHPAYERILGELAPDEARMLVLLAREGPQPIVDVRTGGPVGLVNSQLIAGGLTMVGSRAGLRYPERVPSYLNNLFRLGLAWTSSDALRDPLQYQVLEAQPDVAAAMESVKMAKVVRKGLHLTPFGEDFCRLALIDVEAQTQRLPQHQPPPDDDDSTTPQL